MPPQMDLEIRKELVRYLSGKISLQDFQTWFIPTIWNIDKTKNQTTEALAYEIMLRLAEFSNGDWTEDDLKLKFSSLAGASPQDLSAPHPLPGYHQRP